MNLQSQQIEKIKTNRERTKPFTQIPTLPLVWFANTYRWSSFFLLDTGHYSRNPFIPELLQRYKLCLQFARGRRNDEM